MQIGNLHLMFGYAVHVVNILRIQIDTYVN
jgi:hypothetical protein